MRNFVICDHEEQYSKNLLRVLARKKTPEIQMFLFHTPDETKRFAQQKKIHILLIGEECPQDQRMKISAEERYVLTRNMAGTLSEEERGIYRYQSAGQIWSQIIEQSVPIRRRPETGTHGGGTNKKRKKQKAGIVRAAESRGELIAVYSPVHRIGKTTFALDLGKKLAQKEPVLYLNLEEYAGDTFPTQTSAGQEQNLADLLYYFRQGTENLAIRMSAMAEQNDRLDYILPMPYLQDMQAVKGEEWIRLFHRILKDCIYEKVILDLGDSVDGIWDIMEHCAVVYTPYIEEQAAKAKLKQYFDNLQKTGRESILEKTIQKKMQG